MCNENLVEAVDDDSIVYIGDVSISTRWYKRNPSDAPMNESLEKASCLSSSEDWIWKDTMYNVPATGSRPGTGRWLDCDGREVAFKKNGVI